MFSARTLPVVLAAALLALACIPPILPGLAADDEVSATQPERKRKAPRPAAKRRAAEPPLREIHVAVLPIGATREVKIDPEALTDQVHVLMASLPAVTLVDRAEIDKVIQEQELALTGLVDANRAVELGKLLSAQYILVGRASRVGESYYLVLRLIEVETTRQTTISAKGPADLDRADQIDFVRRRGMSVVIENLAEVLPGKIRQLQSLPLDSETLQRIEELRETLAPFRGLRFLVQVPESHVRSSIPDPAAQMMITHFLSSLDIEFLVPKDPPGNWKERLLQTGVYDGQKIDYLLEGEGVSEFAGRIQGLVSCRARVELRLIKLPGRSIATIERGVGAGVDLTESLSSKTALEKAGLQAIEALLRRAAEKRETP